MFPFRRVTVLLDDVQQAEVDDEMDELRWQVVAARAGCRRRQLRLTTPSLERGHKCAQHA